MSRIAKEPVVVPQGVEVAIDGQKVTIKSKSGEMSLNVHPLVSVTLDNGALKVAVKDESKEANMQSGTTRALLNNYVVGLDKGFVKAMKLVGVGYRAAVKAKVRAFRAPEPYKGKGVRYADEVIHIKEAKKK